MKNMKKNVNLSVAVMVVVMIALLSVFKLKKQTSRFLQMFIRETPG